MRPVFLSEDAHPVLSGGSDRVGKKKKITEAGTDEAAQVMTLASIQAVKAIDVLQLGRRKP